MREKERERGQTYIKTEKSRYMYHRGIFLKITDVIIHVHVVINRTHLSSRLFAVRVPAEDLVVLGC